MEAPKITFELAIQINADSENSRIFTREQLSAYLVIQGHESFVEGTVDNVFLDPSEEDSFQKFVELGGLDSYIQVYSYNQEDLQTLAKRLNSTFAGRVLTEVRAFATEDWLEGWKAFFKPVSCGPFLIHPPWHKPTNTHLTPIEIQPAMAFGTGQHETTQLCLEALANLNQLKRISSDTKVLDVGSGSGILSIAARKLGVQSVTGTDIDPLAIQAVDDNAARNQCSIQMKLCHHPHQVECPEGGFDIIFANILKPVIEALLPDLPTIAAQGSYLILSGFLVEDCEELLKLAEQVGLRKSFSLSTDPWVCLVLEKV